MKQFINEHPIITFLMLDSVVAGVVKCVSMITGKSPSANSLTINVPAKKEEEEVVVDEA